ncbi:MAG: hypothetical protein ABSF35_20360, partial [Polyangia bacterium]
LVPQWAESFGDANYDQAAKAVGVSSTGNVFIGGAYEGSLGALGLTASSNTALDAFTAELSGVDGSVICAHSYGDAAGTQQVTAVTVARAASGAMTDSTMIGGSFTNTITLGSISLLTPGTVVCTLDADCPLGSGETCSHGYCVSPDPSTSKSFISRLSP